jgi:hypothetical protein
VVAGGAQDLNIPDTARTSISEGQYVIEFDAVVLAELVRFDWFARVSNPRADPAIAIEDLERQLSDRARKGARMGRIWYKARRPPVVLGPQRIPKQAEARLTEPATA